MTGSTASYSVGNVLANSDGTRNDMMIGESVDMAGAASWAVYNGNTLVSGSIVNGSISTIPNNTVSSGVTDLPVDFAAAQTSLTDLSSTLSGLSANGTFFDDGYGKISLTGTDSELNVFNLTAAEWMSTVTYGLTYTIDVPDASTVLINISGSSISMEYDVITGAGTATDMDKVLFNFFEATEINLTSSQVRGSILAVDANLDLNGGEIYGQTVANSLTQTTGTLANVAFTGVIPEPAIISLLGISGLCIFIGRRVKQAFA
jgi:choice-of-anchor A domain-containing protein